MAPAGRDVRVAVEALADRPERTFSYRLPPSSADAGAGLPAARPVRAAAGARLRAGRRGRATPAGELKPVEAVVSAPMLTPDLLALAEEIAVYYRAPIGTTLAAMLPPGLESRLARRWS